MTFFVYICFSSLKIMYWRNLKSQCCKFGCFLCRNLAIYIQSTWDFLQYLLWLANCKRLPVSVKQSLLNEFIQIMPYTQYAWNIFAVEMELRQLDILHIHMYTCECELRICGTNGRQWKSISIPAIIFYMVQNQTMINQPLSTHKMFPNTKWQFTIVCGDDMLAILCYWTLWTI